MEYVRSDVSLFYCWVVVVMSLSFGRGGGRFVFRGFKTVFNGE